MTRVQGWRPAQFLPPTAAPHLPDGTVKTERPQRKETEHDGGRFRFIAGLGAERVEHGGDGAFILQGYLRILL